MRSAAFTAPVLSALLATSLCVAPRPAHADAPAPACLPDDGGTCDPEPTCGYASLPCCEDGTGPFGDGCLDGFTACIQHDDGAYCEEA